jgi:WD40 repeat protein
LLHENLSVMIRETVILFSILILFKSVGLGQNQKIIDSLKHQLIIAERIAIQAKKEADRRRYLSLAQSIAESSLEVRDLELSNLLAIQASNFNMKYGGYRYNPKIHHALTKALLKSHRLPAEIQDSPKTSKQILTPTNATFLLSLGNDGVLTRLTQQDEQWRSDFVVKVNTKQKIQALAINDSGDLLAVGGTSGSIEVYNLNNPLQKPEIVNLGSKMIDQIVFSPQEKGFFVLVNKGLQILYCDMKKSKEVVTLKARIVAIGISEDKLHLVGLNIQGFLHVWSLNDFSEGVLTRVMSENAPTVLLSRFRDTYFIGNDVGEIRIITEGYVRRVLWNSTSPITNIQFSHDNKLMAASSQDNSILIWNMEALKEKPIVIPNQDVINGFAFSPDDNFIVFNCSQLSSDSKSMTLRVWPLRCAQMTAMLCGSIKRNLTKEEWEIYVAEDLPIEAICHRE